MSDHLPSSESGNPPLDEPSTSNERKRQKVEPVEKEKKEKKQLPKKKKKSKSSLNQNEVVNEEDDMYEVEKIVDRKMVDSENLYCVKWINYDSIDNSWEPCESFTEPKIVTEFDNRLKTLRMEDGFCQEIQDIHLWPSLRQLVEILKKESKAGRKTLLMEHVDKFCCEEMAKIMFVTTKENRFFLVGLRIIHSYKYILSTSQKKITNQDDPDYPYYFTSDEHVLMPKEVDRFRGKAIAQVACGSGHFMVRTEDGELYEFKSSQVDNWYANIPTPRFRMGLTRKAVIVSCGVGHVAVIDSEGCLHTWGDNTFGQLGRPLPKDEYASYLPDHDLEVYRPVIPKELHKSVIQLQCGAYFTLALTDSNQIFYAGVSDHIHAQFHLINWNYPEPVIAFGRLATTTCSFSLISASCVHFCHIPHPVAANRNVNDVMTSFTLRTSATSVLHYFDHFALVETSSDTYVLTPRVEKEKLELKTKPLAFKAASLVDLAAILGFYDTIDLIKVKYIPKQQLTPFNNIFNDMHAFRTYTGPLLYNVSRPYLFYPAHFNSDFLSIRSPKFFKQIEGQRQPLSLGQYLYAYWLYTNKLIDVDRLCFIYFVYGYYMHSFIQVEPGKENPDLVMAKAMADRIVGKLSEIVTCSNRNAFNEFLYEKLSMLFRYDFKMIGQLKYLLHKGQFVEPYLMFAALRLIIKEGLNAYNKNKQVVNMEAFGIGKF